MNAILWNDGTRPRYASINLDCGLTIEEIAALVVPEGVEWTAVDVADAMAAVAPYTAEERRSSLMLSFAQLLIGLVAEGWITEAEGKAWLAGTLPAAVNGLIDQLPADQQFAAYARATRPTEVLRLDPLVVALAQSAQKTPEEMDQFFLTYSQV